MAGARPFLDLTARGLRDSLQGIFRLYDIDAAQRAEQLVADQQESKPMSTLARSRANRHPPDPSAKLKDPRVLHRILMCCAWNGGVFWLSILVFEYLLLPMLHFFTRLFFGNPTTHGLVWGWIAPVTIWTFSALWVLPLFAISKIINSLWFQDIADAAYRRTRGRPLLLPSLSRIIADIVFSLLLQSLFLVQGMFASLLPLPVIGHAIFLLHMCLLYSLYAFEYKWFNMGWEVHKRLSYIETNWVYFFGFGLPLGLLTSMPTSLVVSGCVFSILFPLFIISANEAEAIPYTIDFPLRLFSPVVSISDAIFRVTMPPPDSMRPVPYKSRLTDSPKSRTTDSPSILKRRVH